jgi:hypothetical protein
LSAKILTTAGWLALGWLSISGCRQVPPGQLQKNSTAAAAGAPAKGMAAANGQKTTTGKSVMDGTAAMAGSGGDPAKSGGMAAMNTAAGNAMAAGAAGGAAPAAAAAMKANPKAIPACEGKADEYACDATMLYHCVNGAYEGRAQSCKTEAQCQAGLTTGQCGECDPGTFQCQDIELQMCDATGTFVLAMECASAKLCKEDKGLCDDQICREGEYNCDTDQLQTCNRDFTDWENEGSACDPGLCSVAAMGCLECLPGSAATCSDESTVQGCTMDGKLDPKPCPKDTPLCSEAKCVQCIQASDCGESMNDCGTLTCTGGMCVPGDPKPKGTACSSNGGKMCDYLGSCVVCATDLDCMDSTKRCFLQSMCVSKNAITATPLLSTISVTVSPGFKAQILEYPISGLTGATGSELNSSQAIDVTYLLGVNNHTACGFTQVAPNDGSQIRLQFALDSMGMGGNCLAPDVSFTLIAHSTTKP